MIDSKDFKVGQKLVCVKLKTHDYIGDRPDDERLIIGEKYEITDVDSRIPDRVCIKLKSPYYFHEEFVPKECFNDIEGIREYKLNKLLNK